MANNIQNVVNVNLIPKLNLQKNKNNFKNWDSFQKNNGLFINDSLTPVSLTDNGHGSLSVLDDNGNSYNIQSGRLYKNGNYVSAISLRNGVSNDNVDFVYYYYGVENHSRKLVTCYVNSENRIFVTLGDKQYEIGYLPVTNSSLIFTPVYAMNNKARFILAYWNNNDAILNILYFTLNGDNFTYTTQSFSGIIFSAPSNPFLDFGELLLQRTNSTQRFGLSVFSKSGVSIRFLEGDKPYNFLLRQEGENLIILKWDQVLSETDYSVIPRRLIYNSNINFKRDPLTYPSNASNHNSGQAIPSSFCFISRPGYKTDSLGNRIPIADVRYFGNYYNYSGSGLYNDKGPSEALCSEFYLAEWEDGLNFTPDSTVNIRFEAPISVAKYQHDIDHPDQSEIPYYPYIRGCRTALFRGYIQQDIIWEMSDAPDDYIMTIQFTNQNGNYCGSGLFDCETVVDTNEWYLGAHYKQSNGIRFNCNATGSLPVYTCINNEIISGITSNFENALIPWNDIQRVIYACDDIISYIDKNGNKRLITYKEPEIIDIIENWLIVNSDSGYNVYNIQDESVSKWTPGFNNHTKTGRLIEDNVYQTCLAFVSTGNGVWQVSSVNNKYNISNLPFRGMQDAPRNLKFAMGTPNSLVGANQYIKTQLFYGNNTPPEYTTSYTNIQTTTTESSLTGQTYDYDNTKVELGPCLSMKIRKFFNNIIYAFFNETAFRFIKNNNQSVVYSYTSSSFIDTISDIFSVQGLIFAIKNKAIYNIKEINGTDVTLDSVSITPVNGLLFMGSTIKKAYFFSNAKKAIYEFSGDCDLTEVWNVTEAAEIKYFSTIPQENILLVSYNTVENEPVTVLFMKEGMLKFDFITSQFKINDNGDLLFCTDDGFLKTLNCFNGDKLKLTTDWFGLNQEMMLDCVYFNLDKIKESGNFKIKSYFIQNGEKSESESKTFNINALNCKIGNNTVLIRYQPRIKHFQAIKFKIESDFPIDYWQVATLPAAMPVTKINI